MNPDFLLYLLWAYFIASSFRLEKNSDLLLYLLLTYCFYHSGPEMKPCATEQALNLPQLVYMIEGQTVEQVVAVTTRDLSTSILQNLIWMGNVNI